MTFFTSPKILSKIKNDWDEDESGRLHFFSLSFNDLLENYVKGLLIKNQKESSLSISCLFYKAMSKHF